MTRTLTRPERRAIQREDERIVTLPVVIVPGAPITTRIVEAHVRHVARLLRSPKSAAPSHNVMTHVFATLARSAAAHGKSPALACRKGCAHCCHQLVTLLPP